MQALLYKDILADADLLSYREPYLPNKPLPCLLSPLQASVRGEDYLGPLTTTQQRRQAIRRSTAIQSTANLQLRPAK